jgi:hypothetical protein
MKRKIQSDREDAPKKAKQEPLPQLFILEIVAWNISQRDDYFEWWTLWAYLDQWQRDFRMELRAIGRSQCKRLKRSYKANPKINFKRRFERLALWDLWERTRRCPTVLGDFNKISVLVPGRYYVFYRMDEGGFRIAHLFVVSKKKISPFMKSTSFFHKRLLDAQTLVGSLMVKKDQSVAEVFKMYEYGTTWKLKQQRTLLQSVAAWNWLSDEDILKEVQKMAKSNAWDF